jgi:hypothetical protein
MLKLVEQTSVMMVMRSKPGFSGTAVQVVSSRGSGGNFVP